MIRLKPSLVGKSSGSEKSALWACQHVFFVFWQTVFASCYVIMFWWWSRSEWTRISTRTSRNPPPHTFFAQSNAHPHSLRTIHHMFALHPVHHTHELLAIPLIHSLSDSSWLVVWWVIRIVGTRFFLSDHFNYLRTFLQIWAKHDLHKSIFQMDSKPGFSDEGRPHRPPSQCTPMFFIR